MILALFESFMSDCVYAIAGAGCLQPALTKLHTAAVGTGDGVLCVYTGSVCLSVCDSVLCVCRM